MRTYVCVHTHFPGKALSPRPPPLAQIIFSFPRRAAACVRACSVQLACTSTVQCSSAVAQPKQFFIRDIHLAMQLYLRRKEEAIIGAHFSQDLKHFRRNSRISHARNIQVQKLGIQILFCRHVPTSATALGIYGVVVPICFQYYSYCSAAFLAQQLAFHAVLYTAY